MKRRRQKDSAATLAIGSLAKNTKLNYEMTKKGISQSLKYLQSELDKISHNLDKFDESDKKEIKSSVDTIKNIVKSYQKMKAVDTRKVKDATYTPNMFEGVSVKEVMEKNKYMRPDAVFYRGKRVDPKIVMNKPVSHIEVSSGVVYYYVKDAGNYYTVTLENGKKYERVPVTSGKQAIERVAAVEARKGGGNFTHIKLLAKAIKDAKVCDKVYSANQVERCAEYLWTWIDPNTPHSIADSLFSKCLKCLPDDMTAKEAYQKASKEAEKELNVFYQDLKSKVDSNLKSGYKKQLDRIKAFGKR